MTGQLEKISQKSIELFQTSKHIFEGSIES